MSIDAEVLSSKPVNALCDMFAGEYAARSFAPTRSFVPSILNAIGACAGFAAQAAVWRELILPTNRNPGDFLASLKPKASATDVYFSGGAVQIFLLAIESDRLTFLGMAGGALSNPSEMVDLAELLGHAARSVGAAEFGRPRVPPSISLIELPRRALSRTWGKTAHILADCRPAEWPALLGAAAFNFINSNRRFLEPRVAIRILLDAAVPMSKLDPATVEQSGIPAISLADWNMRALHAESNTEVLAEVRNVLPTMPPSISTAPIVIDWPKIAFLNLSGASSEAIPAEDQTAFAGLFKGKVEVSTAQVPSCDVLFLYCAFDPSGAIAGMQMSLRSLIRESGAVIVVVASDVPRAIITEQLTKAWSHADNPPVNLVVTGNRNGEAFGRFFKSLFDYMFSGFPMPMAWVMLAPQGPDPARDIPGTLCVMEAGQVAFGRPRPEKKDPPLSTSRFELPMPSLKGGGAIARAATASSAPAGPKEVRPAEEEMMTRIAPGGRVELIDAHGQPIAGFKTLSAHQSAFLGRSLIAAAAGLSGTQPPESGEVIAHAHIGVMLWKVAALRLNGDPALVLKISPKVELIFHTNPQTAVEIGNALMTTGSTMLGASPEGPAN